MLDITTWLLVGTIFILLVIIWKGWRKIRNYQSRLTKRKQDHKVDVDDKNATIRRLEAKVTTLRKRRKEWYPIGVIIPGIKAGGDDRVYTIVEFNPETGELRAPPAQYCFFTINAHDPSCWDRCGGKGVPLTELSAPPYEMIYADNQAIPTLCMLGEFYRFRFNSPNPFVAAPDDTPPVFLAQDNHQEETSRELTVASR